MTRLVRSLLAGLALSPGAAFCLQVTIVEPPFGQPLFGQQVFEAAIVPRNEVRHVTFVVDGVSVATLSTPPFRIEVDVGDQNLPHRFEVQAEDLNGKIFSNVIETPALPIDLEVDLELQQLYLTVTRNEQRVDGLTRAAFTVLDSGRPQEIVTFEGGDVPFAAVLLVDASQSMKGLRLATAVAGVQTFAHSMRPLDQAKLLLFSDQIRYSTPFSSFPQILTLGLSEASAGGGTSLNDHLYIALKLLEIRQGRRLVILLSDGLDITSTLGMTDVRQVARRSQALIYWIRLGAPDPRLSHFSAWRNGKEHKRELDQLETVIEESGGRVLTIATINQAPAAFVDILDEIRSQYVIGYYPSLDLGDGGWRKVRIRVKNQSLDVRTRNGYIDF